MRDAIRWFKCKLKPPKKEDDKNTALWFGRKFFTNSGIEFDFFCR